MIKDIKIFLVDCILVFDGVMGMMIQCYYFEEEDFCKGWFDDYVFLFKGNNDFLLFIWLDIICEIYWQYLEVGVDIIEMNIFFGIWIVQVDYYFEFVVYDINYYGVKIVKEVVDEFIVVNFEKLCFVVGFIGLINCMVFIFLDVNDLGFWVIIFDELVDVYKQQVNVLMDGGVDILLVEMVFDIFNVKVVLYVIDEVFELCKVSLLIMVLGIIIDQSGCILMGQIMDVFLVFVQYMLLLFIGLNCVFGVDMMCLYLYIFFLEVLFGVSVYFNVGLLNEFG